MRTAKLKIISRGDGWQERLEAPCIVDGSAVKYKNGGDDCALYMQENSLGMSRRGSASLNLLFTRGESTVCTVGSPETGAGEVPCFTDLLEIKEGKRGINIKLGYSLGGQDVSLSAIIIYDI